MINKEKFYIPQDQAESYDGSVLRFRISEDEIINKYMSDMPPSLNHLKLKRLVTEFNNKGREYKKLRSH